MSHALQYLRNWFCRESDFVTQILSLKWCVCCLWNCINSVQCGNPYMLDLITFFQSGPVARTTALNRWLIHYVGLSLVVLICENIRVLSSITCTLLVKILFHFENLMSWTMCNFRGLCMLFSMSEACYSHDSCMLFSMNEACYSHDSWMVFSTSGACTPPSWIGHALSCEWSMPLSWFGMELVTFMDGARCPL